VWFGSPIMLEWTLRRPAERAIEHDRRNKGPRSARLSMIGATRAPGAGQTLAPQLVMSLELKLAQAKPSSTIT
jgi:hypothetical protein